MSAPADQKSPAPESPTTARPLELDDDDFQETPLNTDEAASKAATASSTPADGTSSTAAPAAAAAATTASGAAAAGAAEEHAPPKPPRPLTEQQKNAQTLKEAFPTVDLPVIKAILTASRGNVEDAFHALLEMTDPDAIEHEHEHELPPPPQPPRPLRQDPVPPGGRLSPNTQMLADEEYARQLAQHYETEGAYEARTSGRGGRGRGPGGSYQGSRQRHETGLKPNEMWDDKEHSFLDDDLPVIRENLRKGFVETQTKFNTWFSGIKKRIDEEWNANDDYDDDGHERPRPTQQQQQQQQRFGGGRGGFGAQQPPRRSGDYDADPQVLSDDFAGIQLHGDGTPVRTSANNPHVFRPPPPSSSPRPSADGRKVAFRDSDEVIDVYNASPRTATAKDGSGSGAAAGVTSPGGPGSATKGSKWQPMSPVDPAPIGDSDPFSLGDSEDEKDPGTKTAVAATGAAAKTDKPAAGPSAAEGAAADKKSTSPEEAERLRKAAAEAMADSLVEDKSKA